VEKHYNIILFFFLFIFIYNILPASQTNDLKYIVKKGDYLSLISKKYYNRGAYWPRIYKHNSDTVKDPDLIFPGQVLLIPGIKGKEETPKLTDDLRKPDFVEESVDLLNEIPHFNDYDPNKVILYQDKVDKKNMDNFLPPQLNSEDFEEVKSLASAELENKEIKNNKLFITVCDLKVVTVKEGFWEKIKKKIMDSEELKGKVETFSNAKLQGFSFEISPDKYTFFKKFNPHVVTILKTKIEYEKDITTFTELLTGKEGILKDKKIKDEVFLLPSTLPTGFKFQEFYLEKIPEEYIKEKPQSEWVKKMVGKMNLSAVYIDKDKAEWTINLFNMGNEEEAKNIYDEHFSRGKEKILEKLNQSRQNSPEEAKSLQLLLDMGGHFKRIRINSYEGWLVENKMKNISELSFRASYYIVTIAVTKLEQKDILIQLAESLQIEKIIKNREIIVPEITE